VARANLYGPALVAGLKLSVMARELAASSELVQMDTDSVRLRVPVKALAEAGNVERLRIALNEALGRPMRLSVEIGAAQDTASARAERARNDRQKRAEQSIYEDPFVQQLIENFGATVDPASIKPVD